MLPMLLLVTSPVYVSGIFAVCTVCGCGCNPLVFSAQLGRLCVTNTISKRVFISGPEFPPCPQGLRIGCAREEFICMQGFLMQKRHDGISTHS